MKRHFLLNGPLATSRRGITETEARGYHHVFD
jgi:hypothetical protein